MGATFGGSGVVVPSRRKIAPRHQEGNMGKTTRREFIGKVGATAVGASLAAKGLSIPKSESSAKKKVMANDKVVIGLIGCGGMGAANMRNLMGHPEVEVAALCDVDENRVPGDLAEVEKKYGKKPSVYKDYRKMLERKDINAIIVGTPDQWHALNLIHTVEAGKDSYCEKPISHNITEAVAMMNATKYHKKIVQVGTWQRSTREFTDAIAYIRSGKLGKIVSCRAWITDGFRAGRHQPESVPKGLDYDFWIGPAAMVPYVPSRVHFNWRWFMNTGSGMSGDWGVHMIDIALLGMSKSNDLVMPTEIHSIGGQWAITDDDRTAYDTNETIMKFNDPNFVLTWSVLRDHPGKPGHGTEFVSADGKTLRVWRGGWVVLDPDGKELPKEQANPPSDHWRNWLDCLVSRKSPTGDIASVGQTTIVCHLANAALMAGETVKWDKSKMDIAGKAGKDTMAYSRKYRAPWKLPVYKTTQGQSG